MSPGLALARSGAPGVHVEPPRWAPTIHNRPPPRAPRLPSGQPARRRCVEADRGFGRLGALACGTRVWANPPTQGPPVHYSPRATASAASLLPRATHHRPRYGRWYRVGGRTGHDCRAASFPAPCLCPAGPPWPFWPVGRRSRGGLRLDVVLAPAVLAIPSGICPCPLAGRLRWVVFWVGSPIRSAPFALGGVLGKF